MLILEAGNIKKYYSDRLVVGFDGFRLYSGDKIGIVGQNGSGKTTLMNILSGDVEPDEGYVRRYCDIAYIRQFSDETINAEQRVLKEFSLAGLKHQQVYSGGERTRIRIANAVSDEKVIMFADEPTSNLDFKGIELLKQKLSESDTLLLISHDRELLDFLCNRIIEVGAGGIRVYNGNYTSYREQKAAELQRAQQEYEQYAADRTNLEGAIADRKNKAKSIKKAPKRMGNSEARLHRRSANEIQEKLHSAVNSLKTRLEKLEVKDKPRELPMIKLDFSLTDPPENKVVVSAEDLSFSYGSRRIFERAGFILYNGSKTALWGENGTGKTTLLNLINDKSAEGIRIVPKARIGFFRQGFENLEDDKTVLENVMRESVQSQTVARTILARLLISGDDVYKKISVLSGGERIKVSFAKLFVSACNILLLDEPTNYLDMQSLEALEKMLCEYEGTVLFVSHDRAFVNAVADRLLVIEKNTLTGYDGNLDAYKAGKRKAGSDSAGETERSVLQMRLTGVVARLSQPSADKEALEAEYQDLLQKLKKLAPGPSRTHPRPLS